jgi:hypothetical protein
MKSAAGTTCSLIVLSFACTVWMRAGEIPIDLSALANEPWTYVGPNDFIIINGGTFPTGTQNLGGVPFAIPAGQNNYWAGAAAADFGPGTVNLTIPVGVYGVTSVFTVLNSMWGWPGPKAYLFITFNGSRGATKTAELVGNVNVRDYNQDDNTNTIDNTSTVQVWNNGMGQRLDRQEYILPAAFAGQELISVTITDTGNEGEGTNGSRAILAALTVSTCHAYVTEGLTSSLGPITYHPDMRLYTQNVDLKNESGAAISGPIYLILEGLPATVSLVNESKPTACFAPIGSPYLGVLPKGYSLAPNTTAVVHLGFIDPSGTAISYTPLAAGGPGDSP